MSDFFGRMVERALGTSPRIQPRIAGLFEPSAAAWGPCWSAEDSDSEMNVASAPVTRERGGSSRDAQGERADDLVEPAESRGELRREEARQHREDARRLDAPRVFARTAVRSVPAQSARGAPNAASTPSAGRARRGGSPPAERSQLVADGVAPDEPTARSHDEPNPRPSSSAASRERAPVRQPSMSARDHAGDRELHRPRGAAVHAASMSARDHAGDREGEIGSRPGRVASAAAPASRSEAAPTVRADIERGHPLAQRSGAHQGRSPTARDRVVASSSAELGSDAQGRRSPTARSGREREPAPAPAVQVTIGRVEVRAAAPSAPPRRRRRAQSSTSLDEYLAHHTGGKR